MASNAQFGISRREFLRRVSAATVSIAAVGALGACAPAVSPAAPQAGAPTMEAGGVVKWAEFYSLLTDLNGQLNQEWIAGVVKQFEEENPGWTVELEGVKWDLIDQRSILDLSAGVDHDLMFSSPQLMAKHQQVGDYIDLTPLIEQWAKEEQDDLNWSPGWKAASVGGQQVGIATGVHTRTNVYNRDMFTEAGLDPDKHLTTPEEVVEAGKLMTKADQDIWGLGMYMGPSRATIELYYAPMVWHYGGDFYDADAKKANLTGDASLQATQWLFDLVHTHKITPPYSYAADADYGVVINTRFAEGKIAQGMGFGSYWIGTLEENGLIDGCFPATPECKVGTAGVMVVPTSAKAQFTNAWCLSIHKLSQHPEMAWKLLEVVLRSENLKTYPDAGLPARLSAWAAPEYQSDFYNIWLEAAKNGRPMPPTPAYPELADTVAAGLQEILANKADIASTLQKFEDEWNTKYAG
jgi:ABC-type glycerol-3-phosphate transport system substrate-binding protein